MSGLTTIAKVALAATSIGGLTGVSYFFRDELRGTIARLSGHEDVKVSKDVIAEYIYKKDNNSEQIFCEQLSKKKASTIKLTPKECEKYSGLWKNKSKESENKTDVLVRVNEKYLENIFRGEFNSPSRDNFSFRMREGLKKGLLIENSKKICKSDLVANDGKIIVTCETQETIQIPSS
ncbi:hypothetical protein [Mycoplasma suis]|uniref:Uncharacterized protein n=2 Tax=Mycoplasma suis TaxID=57372 RepID=F0QQ88_MYCSL|nr:hypothetical protein [Mycoplasma suis]ADX97658.1 hypothetical protein MSU_0114 [Mycoplasma suis str. Illinois]CBZ40195.1 hypothetical protein MSUIS_01020 [Mycoplasma suis KI3806]